jgi:hypothetical protein
MTNKPADERSTPQGGQPTPNGVKVERKEGRVGAQNESVGGEVDRNKYDRNK